MSENDLLGDELGGEQEYTLGNEEEDRLLADDHTVSSAVKAAPVKTDADVKPLMQDIKPLMQTQTQDVKPLMQDRKPHPPLRKEVPPLMQTHHPPPFVTNEEFNIGPPTKDGFVDFSEDILLGPSQNADNGPRNRGGIRKGFIKPRMQKKMSPMVDNRHIPHRMQHFGPRPPFPPPPPFRRFEAEQEVRMKPIPTITTAKKVLINPHFKGHINIIERNSIEDAAERFIAEQRLVLARNHHRNISVRVDRYSDEYPPGTEDSAERELLRKQEEFINANRAGLRRRMRSPSPLSMSPPTERRKRSPLPRRSPPPRERERERDRDRRIPRDDDDKDLDQETIEYRRRIRHRDELRTRVLQAKEERRRANAYQRHLEAERESKEKAAAAAAAAAQTDNQTETQADKPTTTSVPAPITSAVPPPPRWPESAPAPKKSVLQRVQAPPSDTEFRPEAKRQGKPPALVLHKVEPKPEKEESVSPLAEEDEALELEMAMDELEEVLYADEEELIANLKKDKEKAAAAKAKPILKPPNATDLRSKLPPKQPPPPQPERPRQKIVFELNEVKKTPPREEVAGQKRKLATSEDIATKKASITIEASSVKGAFESRSIFSKKFDTLNEDKNVTALTTKSLPNRRVVLQRAADAKVNPTSIFSKALSNIKINKGGAHEPTIIIEGKLEKPTMGDVPDDGLIRKVIVDNLPPGMTELRLKTLAGNNCTKADIMRDLSRAELTFTGLASAEYFFKRFNNRTVAACMLKLTMV